MADALGIDHVIVPPFSGVLSALGMGLADQRVITDQALESPLEDLDTINAAADQVRASAQTRLAEQGIKENDQQVAVRVRLKYQGTDTALSVPLSGRDETKAAFEVAHKTQFGFTEPDQAIFVEAVEAEAVGGGAATALNLTANSDNTKPEGSYRFFSEGEMRDAAVYHRERLKPDHEIMGPAVILENGGTTVLEPGWAASLKADDTLLLHRAAERSRRDIDTSKPDPIMLEIFNNLFMSVAEEMGGVLAKTAHSVNVKERLDFSCAVFDKAGNLIANAPHMPVHLGSMGESVTSIIEARKGTIKPGDVFMLNDPFAGGTHLPDITVITPVFFEGDAEPHFYVASRGHHADIGGISPGSMPPNSKTIDQEGIRFSNFKLVSEGSFNTTDLRDRLSEGPYPSRNLDQNVADLKAQVAANERGVALVRKLAIDFGRDVVDAYMGHVQDNAEEAVRRVIDRLKDGSFTYPMDCGAQVCVRLSTNRNARTVTVDFTGTSPVQDNNFNAPLAVTKAAVLYVFRTLTGEDIPLNAGCLKPINMIVPEGSMLNPTPPAAVVAGNVETSQVVTNALFLAAGTMAAAQGTMNNLTFGNSRHQYYETIAGGTGAGPTFDGTDAIQSHMTNSRLTDPEVMEWRYPVRVETFGIRGGSGGAGAHTGGNGAVRTIRFLEDMEVSILSGHRSDGPPGLNGGAPGKPGATFVTRKDGSEQTLAASDAAEVSPGDCVTVETPGGGGYGAP